MRILTFVAYYLPGWKSGGPVRTIANLVATLGAEVEFRIVTSDRDALDAGPYGGVKVSEWNRGEGGYVYYTGSGERTLSGMARILRNTRHDVLYLNSFFNPTFTGLPLLARRLGMVPRRPCVLAPRGEFSPGALELKREKKRIYMWLARATGLYDGLVWQASSDEEAEYIRGAMGEECTVLVAPNVPSTFEWKPRAEPRGEGSRSLRIVFLSRVTPKKNLAMALRMLARVSEPVGFDIYGVVDDEAYWMECQRIVEEQMPEHVVVSYRGVLDHEEVYETLSRYDLFFLPTRGENYGHAIYEALAAGVPVLISDQTPWRNLRRKGVGWDLPLESLEGFVDVIEEWCATPSEERLATRRRAAAYARKIATDPTAVEKNRALFRFAINRAG